MSEPELTPQQDEQVRRLLAEARHDAPIPADVAARLDDVLAGLSPGDTAAHEAAPDPAPAPSAPVVDLAARRRRRNASVLLAAAAAVIVGGFGVSRVIDVGSSDSDAGGGGSAADSAVDREASDDSAAGSADEAAPSSAPETDSQLRAGEPLQLSSQSLARDVEAQLPGADALPAPQGEGANAVPQDVSACATALPRAYGTGEFFPAFYDGIPALLALRPPDGDRQRADVLDCDTAEQLDSVQLPAP